MQTRPASNTVGRDVQNVVSEAQELLKTVKDEGATFGLSRKIALGDDSDLAEAEGYSTEPAS